MDRCCCLLQDDPRRAQLLLLLFVVVVVAETKPQHSLSELVLGGLGRPFEKGRWRQATALAAGCAVRSVWFFLPVIMIMIFIATKKNHQQRIVGQCDKDQLQIILALDEGRHVVVVKAFVIITRGGRRRVVQEPGQTDLVLVEFRPHGWWQGIVMIQAIVANGHVGQGMIGGEGLGKGLGDGRLQCRWFFHSLAGGCRGGGVLAGGSGMLEDLQFLQGARRGRLQSLDHLNGFAMNRGGSGPRNPQLQVRQARVDGQHSGHGGATRRPRWFQAYQATMPSTKIHRNSQTNSQTVNNDTYKQYFNDVGPPESSRGAGNSAIASQTEHPESIDRLLATTIDHHVADDEELPVCG